MHNKQRNFRRTSRQRRAGIAAIEVLLVIGTIFVVAMMFYWLAQASYVRLYEMIALQAASFFL
ncbi:MAG: hypothetical protein R3C28_26705 [Pirellulaceae bacterium]